MTARDLFISHSSSDVETARDLRQELEAAGYSCWLAPDDVVGTDTWTEQILGAINDCRATIVLVSAAANLSTHVSREVSLALGRGRPILPIRIEPVGPEGSLEYLLSLVQRVDAFPAPISQHRDRILRRISAIAPVLKAPDAADEAGKDEPPTDKAPRKRPKVDRHAAGIGPGTAVAEFVIEAEIGHGGMATVYRARQTEPRRNVALKIIRADRARQPTYAKRFLAESDTLASLEHPGIVPIYAAGDDGGLLYIAMRLIDGVDLSTRIANEGKLSLRETVEVLDPIADALDYAHGRGVVHGDLKPANIILDAGGRAYLTDFAIGDREQAGIVTGSVDYMAPEQARANPGSKLEPPSDLYALGCIAFACLTGRPPYAADSPDAVIVAHESAAVPSVRAAWPTLPKVVDEVIGRALAKDPSARFASAGEFIESLRLIVNSAAQGSTQPVVVPERKTPTDTARRWVGANTPIAAIGGALAGIALIVAIARAFGGPGPGPTGTAASSTRVTSAPSGSAVVGDVDPPIGGVVSITPDEGLDGVTTSLDSTLVVLEPPADASGIESYAVSNTPTRPAGAPKAYEESFPWRLATGDGLAGTRTVYVWFADPAGNWMPEPLAASIDFDNPPTAIDNVDYDRTGVEYCQDLQAGASIYLNLVPYVASDADGGTLRITRLWTGSETFEDGTNLSGRIDADGQGAHMTFTGGAPANALHFTDWFTVEDEAGASDDGYFLLHIGPC